MYHTYVHVIHLGLQSAAPTARMEEHIIVHLITLTVPVPVGTQEHTARREV